MREGHDRRGFFRAVAGRAAPQRPPWAVGEDAFRDLCTGCGDCMEACPESILVPVAGGLPRVDFSRGACSLCGACAEACATGALAGGPPSRAWEIVARISDSCLEPRGITCRLCEGVCDEAALRFRPVAGGRTCVAALSDRCTGCGACVAACPAGAITMATPQVAGQKGGTAA